MGMWDDAAQQDWKRNFIALRSRFLHLDPVWAPPQLVDTIPISPQSAGEVVELYVAPYQLGCDMQACKSLVALHGENMWMR